MANVTGGYKVFTRAAALGGFSSRIAEKAITDEEHRPNPLWIWL
jgi:hypothetical protein